MNLLANWLCRHRNSRSVILDGRSVVDNQMRVGILSRYSSVAIGRVFQYRYIEDVAIECCSTLFD